MKWPTFLFLWTRLGSIWPKAGDVAAISLRATIGTPGQRGGNITMCATISENGVSTHIPHIGTYNTQLHLVPEHKRDYVRPDLPNYVTVWDNVSFPRTNIVGEVFCCAWKDNNGVPSTILPVPESDFFQHGGGIYDYRTQDQMSLLDAMNTACEDITGDHCRGWLRHARRFQMWKHQMWRWQKISGQTNKSDRMSTKKMGTCSVTYCEEVHFFFFFFYSTGRFNPRPAPGG